MIYAIVQLLTALVYPLNLALALGLLGALLRWRRWKRTGTALLIAGVAVLVIFSMPITSNLLVKSLERQYIADLLEQVPAADAIVVLGGGVGAAHPPRQHPQLHSASNRDYYGAQLFHAGKAPWVIVSSEPEAGALLLEQLGVPPENLLVDPRSRNTRENALYALEIMQEQGEIERVLLVTSALHMPRALATFRHAGIEATAAPTDYIVVDSPEDDPYARHRLFIMQFLPTAASLQTSTRAIHEYLGLIYYRLQGWI